MYVKKINIENIGPIDQFRLKINSKGDDAPPPLVLVGANGSGKSLVLAQIVTAIINAHSAVYEDSDIEKGKVFKIRSSSYIRYGQNYSVSEIEFSDGFFEREIVLDRNKKSFEDTLRYAPISQVWNSLSDQDSDALAFNFHTNQEKTREALAGPHIYFPPNRFEDPAWINHLALKNKIDLTQLNRFKGLSHREVIEYAPMKQNQSWLLDLLFDSYAIERQIINVSNNAKLAVPFGMIKHTGPATRLRIEIDKFILKLLDGSGNMTWDLGRRSSRTIGIRAGEKTLTSNLLSLSSGQTVVLDLFLTILRHADWADQTPNSLSDICGLVVIDEIDLHLHTDLQYRMLPHLISLFPGVQFIISSHSPLFLLGLEKKFGEGGATIVDLPSGLRISAERFAEFKNAYNHFAKTRSFEAEVNQKVRDATSPLLIVEGKTDMAYIEKAAEHLEEANLLSRFELLDGNGYGGLDKIWKNFSCDRWNSANQTVILLYDCDVGERNNKVGKAFQRTIPAQDSIIREGIENLLPQELIERAKEHKSAYFDYFSASTRITRGQKLEEPENWSINKDEKRNLCDWICENASKEDFQNFSHIFKILRTCLD